jgi:hypothetical protein
MARQAWGSRTKREGGKMRRLDKVSLDGDDFTIIKIRIYLT